MTAVENRRIVAGVLAACVALAGAVTRADAAEHGHGTQAPEGGKPQTLCPIMGGAIDRDVHLDLDGKRIYFCCAGCPVVFMRDAARHVRDMEAKGIKLEPLPAPAPQTRTDRPSAAGVQTACPVIGTTVDRRTRG